MKRLLLLLPLLLASPAMAESDPFGMGEHVYQRYERAFMNGMEFLDREDYEMACSEFGMANTVVKMHFGLLQQYAPDLDWFETRQLLKDVLEKDCYRGG